MAITAEKLEQKLRIPPGLLDEECTEDNIKDISKFSEVSWEGVAKLLELELSNCDTTNGLAVLRKWKEQYIFDATYRKLVNVFLKINRADLARWVCMLLKTDPLKGTVVSSPPTSPSQHYPLVQESSSPAAQVPVPLSPQSESETTTQSPVLTVIASSKIPNSHSETEAANTATVSMVQQKSTPVRVSGHRQTVDTRHNAFPPRHVRRPGYEATSDHSWITESYRKLQFNEIKKWERVEANSEATVGHCEFTTTDFASCCKDIHKHLIGLNEMHSNRILSRDILRAMEEVRLLLDRKEINISVFGHHNSGKSTLLNALIGDSFLPICRVSETGIRVKIQHDSDVHEGKCSEECPHASKTCPRLIVEKRNKLVGGFKFKEYIGRSKVERKLAKLNARAREGKSAPKVVVLKVHLPLLAENAPPGWRVSLVDNPGFADVKEHISQLAESSVVTSAAYVYLIETQNLEGKEDHDAFKRLAEQDPECITDDRLVIAVAKFDFNYADEMKKRLRYINEEKATELVCKRVESATNNDKFQKGNVFPLCGEWALNSSMLANCPVDDRTYDACLTNAVSSLRKYPRLSDIPSGEGQTDLSTLPPDEIVRLLDKASGLATLKDRIQFMVSKACVKIWGQKMLSEYHKYIEDARCNIDKRVREREETYHGKHYNFMKCKELYEDMIRVRKNIESVTDETAEKETLVWHELEEGFPKDLEMSKPHEEGKVRVGRLMDSFEEICRHQINDENDSFGPVQFEEKLKTFLEEAAKDLEVLFDGCRFPNLNSILLNRVVSMTEECADLAQKANYSFNIDKFHKDENAQLQALTEYNKERESAEAQVSDVQMQFSVSPNLGDIREKVPIPNVSLSFWAVLKRWFLAKFGKATSDQKAEPYRSWADIEGTIDRIKDMLNAECDTFFRDVKPHTIKYFHDQYVQKTKEQLAKFDRRYGDRLAVEERRLEELKGSFEDDERIVLELKEERKRLDSMEQVLMAANSKEFSTYDPPPPPSPPPHCVQSD